jgi:hypothetical protein
VKYAILTGTVVFGTVMFVLWLLLSVVGVPCLYVADLVERLNDRVQDWGYEAVTGRKNGGTA